MKGKLSTVSATEKVLEFVIQHPVLYDQRREENRDSVAANVWKGIAKALEEDFFGMYLQNYRTECRKFFHLFAFFLFEHEPRHRPSLRRG